MATFMFFYLAFSDCSDLSAALCQTWHTSVCRRDMYLSLDTGYITKSTLCISSASWGIRTLLPQIRDKNTTPSKTKPPLTSAADTHNFTAFAQCKISSSMTWNHKQLPMILKAIQKNLSFCILWWYFRWMSDTSWKIVSVIQKRMNIN